METVGYIAPETESEAREEYERCEQAARDICTTILKQLDGQIDEGPTEPLVRTAHDAFFGSVLVVTTGPMADFERVCSQPPLEGYQVNREGSDQVDHVAWHVSPMTETVLAATYQSEREAAISTLRRIAWGRFYRDVVHSDKDECA